MNNWRMVKIGTTQAQRRLFFNLKKEKEKLEAEGYTPGPKLLAQRLEVKEGEIVEMEQRLSHRDLSTDAPIGEDQDLTLLNFLVDDKQTPEDHLAEAEYRQLLKKKIADFARGLKDKELFIFNKRLLTDKTMTLREIGEEFRISRERVRQIEERLKKKLKTYLTEEFKDIKDSMADVG